MTLKTESMHAQLLHSCLTLCNPMDGNPMSLPDSSVHGILQARILEWVAIFSSRGSSQPRDRTHISCVSCVGRRMLYHCATWGALCESYRERHVFWMLNPFIFTHSTKEKVLGPQKYFCPPKVLLEDIVSCWAERRAK